MIRLALIAFLSLSLSAPAFTAEPGQSPWRQKMRRLSAVLEELMLDVHSDERFNAPKNRRHLEKTAEQFADLAQSLNAKDAPKPDGDPTLGIVAGYFGEEAKTAARMLKSGNRGYARAMLKSMTGYCTACHTRNQTGPQYAPVTVSEKLAALKPFERAEFFTSTRRFDEASAEYEKIIAQLNLGRSDPLRLEKALRSALAITVRVKNDPVQALRITDSALRRSAEVPPYLLEQVVRWKAELQIWQSEKPVTDTSEEALFGEAVRQIDLARSTQKFPADRGSEVGYLRATRVLHDLLGAYPNGRRTAEALLMAGAAYDALEGFGLNDLPRAYYLACIHQSPHTPVARACFLRYEESVYVGYSGSGGSYIPPDVRGRLTELDRRSLVRALPAPSESFRLQ